MDGGLLEKIEKEIWKILKTKKKVRKKKKNKTKQKIKRQIVLGKWIYSKIQLW